MPDGYPDRHIGGPNGPFRPTPIRPRRPMSIATPAGRSCDYLNEEESR